MPFTRSEYDAIVIGSGPNGLAAAITIGRAGRSVLLIEGQDAIGGGVRSAELTLPGFVHDVCAAVHPMAAWSPFFRTLPLNEHGLEWIHPPAPLAHPLDDGATVVERSVEETAAALGRDASAYKRLMAPLLTDWPKLEPVLLAPLHLPAHPIAAARFGLLGLRAATALARDTFRDPPGRALFAGLAAHSMLPLERRLSASFGLVLGVTAHAVGWPIARGGSQTIANAMASYLRSLGGEIVTGTPVASLDQLPRSRAILCDVAPKHLLELTGSRLPDGYRRKLAAFRYGPGACKLDWALDGPIPWKADGCRRAGTIHLGGTMEEIAASERGAWEGDISESPFVILAQPTLFDPTRAPTGKHIAWAYCHVPNGSSADMADRIENQVERFAPGFRSLILKRSVRPASSMEAYNPNLVGGDTGGGAVDWKQFFFRPTRRLHRTPARGIYLCSASTPPGGGVHGLCGYLAAQAALRDLF